ncbi:hypothetical protein [Amycolatopsis alkalitolerans]|uniref:Copper resistance protein D domain-containing protein n=1 Tax=Amycolatopsis alkalitolerans TaxID=2547244 RepID=A0A5C4LSL1_9PSEU|nr:hypothetical protein [Amycolatopsis alkalitolerans]TNC20908.1 hypothetical protein FG385_29955 [Amycolatopsis alkalitolerans]
MSAAAAPDWVAVVVRDVVLATAAVIGGVALLRPLVARSGSVPAATRAIRVLTRTAAFVGGTTLVLFAVTGHAVLWLAVPQALFMIGVTFTLGRPALAVASGLVLTLLTAFDAVVVAGHTGWDIAAGTVHTVAAAVWLGATATVATARRGTRYPTLRRLAPAAVTGGILIVLTGIAQAWMDGLRPDATAFGSTFGKVLLLKTALLGIAAVIGVLAHRRRWARSASKVSAVALAGALAAGSTLIAISPPPAAPVPGVPLLRSVPVSASQQLPVLVVPQRPGWNLVHVDSTDVAVGTDRGHLTPVAARPGTTGGWALVELPPGSSKIWIQHGETPTSLHVDTGHGPPATPDIAGPDGPECASAALGALAAGADTPLASCPGDRLANQDARSLAAVVAFIADRGGHTITLVGDSSPRSLAATEVVRDAAAAHHLAIAPRPQADSALLVVSGWTEANTTLLGVLHSQVPSLGAYLAPWLANSRMLAYGSGAVVALRFDPRSPQPLQYATTLRRIAGNDESASAAGYRGWLVAKGASDTGPTSLYAGSLISWLPANLAMPISGGWIENGIIAKITQPLD